MQKRIYRSKNDRIIAGICGGLAQYFDVDPAIVRIIFLLLFFFNGVGFLAYLIMWIVIPVNPYEERVFYSRPGGANGTARKENVSGENVEDAEIIEETEDGKSEGARTEVPVNKTRDNRYVMGIILIVLGGLFLARQFLPFFSFKIILPIVAIAIGVYFLLNSKN